MPTHQDVNRGLRFCILVALFCSWTTTPPMSAQALSSAATSVSAATCVKWADIPLSFEPNVGQESPEVRYLARGSSYTLYLASAEIVLSGHNQDPLRMQLSGANVAPRVVGEDQQVSTSNYLVGNDPSKWRTSVPNFGQTRYQNVYPGIDLVYYGHDGSLEYDWIVSPSADPRRIRLRFDSADHVRVDKQGDLVIETGKTEYHHKKPVVYQEIAGRRVDVAGAWSTHGNEAGFRIGRYDRRQPLVIDPVLYYSTYLGGSGLDAAYAIAVDKAGNTYVTGDTASANFTTANPLQATLMGSQDVFVTKINASGSARLYSTYLGSTGVDNGRGIAVNGRGEVYVTGSAGFSNFPLKNPIQGTWGGSGDAFLAKLNATGSALVYSTYLGGSGVDQANGIALDTAGNAYVVGTTNSTNFPTVNPFQAAKGAQDDAFVAKINPAGSAWVYATYLGGSGEDQGLGIAVDASGNAYLTGYTTSTNFPIQSAFQGANRGGSDGFVTKLNPAGSALVYSTYLGGSGNENNSGTVNGAAIAVDASGSAFVTGSTASDDFPLANPIDATLGSHAVNDVFVTKFSPAGSSLVYSTYLGGGSEDDPYSIALDKAGNAYITGRTNSSDFPLVNPIQITRVAFDMFVTEINAAGSALTFSTFLGGSGSESGRGIAVDFLGNIHIAGESSSTDFPALNGVQMTSGGGGQDGIVLQFGSRLPYVFNDFTGKGCSDGAVRYDPATGQSYTALANGSGSYVDTPNTFSPGYDTLLTGDFNGDGKADLIVYNSKTAAAFIGAGKGDGTFNFQSLFWSPGYDFVETGDVDGDGKTDVILYNSQTGTMYAGISNGDGTFTYVYTLISTGFTYVRLADFTGDGNADLFLYRVTDGLSYLGIGDGSGGFTFLPLHVAPGYNVADSGDINGDGIPDLILYNSANGQAATVLGGVGGLAFASQSLGPGFTSVRLADFTGDGLADITLYNKTAGGGSFGTGTGTGTFTFQPLNWVAGYDYVIPEDVNCDGKVDVILYNSQTGDEFTAFSTGNGLFDYRYTPWGAGKVLADQNVIPIVPPSTVLSSLVLRPAAVVGGQMVQGVVTLSGAPTTSFVVSVSSANPALAAVPATVTVPAGSTSAEFTVRTSTVTAATNINITTTAGTSTFTQPLNVTTQPASGTPPFGLFETPADGATVTGSIAVTGWTLDDLGVTVVNIYRNCIAGVDLAVNCTIVGGNNVVFIGRASFVAGARPDVEAMYPMYPNSVRAGWGYLLLTNMLPHITAPAGPAGGQGSITLYAFATDLDNHQTLIGQKAITLDNDHATTPFGAIDTPTQGGSASGITANYGWALTPGSAMIPISGSTMTVVVDGVAFGTVTYNLCRDGASPPSAPGACHDDIATLFPNTTNIKGNGITIPVGAIGVFTLDTTKLTDGVHTIAWGVSDNQGNTEGIGSRYFTVQNGSSLIATGSAASSSVTTSSGTHAQAVVQSMSTASTTDAAPAQAIGSAMDVAWLPPSGSEVTGQAGFNFDAPKEVIEADASGVRSLRVPELGRIELQLGEGTSAGYLNANGTLRPLPPGSQLNTATGQFTWVPGPGYVGTYDLVFVQGSSQVPVEVTIEPKSTIAAGLMRGWIDLPTPSASVGTSFTVAGWALDSAAWHGSGIGAVHVWATRRNAVGAVPVFLGSASLGGSRPDVASAFGKQFDRAGWSLAASGLPAGVYEVTAYFWSNRTEQFEDARTVTVIVR